MLRQVRTAFMAGALALAALGTASAQLIVPPGTRGLTAYTGIAGPFGYQPGWIPIDRYQPMIWMQYEPAPRLVYVPVAVAMAGSRPAVEAIQTAKVTLKSRTPLSETRVKPGTVVTWTNAETRQLTVILEPAGLSGGDAQAQRQRAAIRPDTSVSLAFHTPGVYRYSLLERPEEQGKIIVEER